MITLRPQQVVFEEAIQGCFRRGVRSVLATAPTGFGKGVVIADMGGKAADKGKAVGIITNRRQIVLQLLEQCGNAGIDTGIIMSGFEPNDLAPVQVATIQTLGRRGFPKEWEPDFLIIDEAHQMAEAYRKLIRETYPSVYALGLTATPVGPGGAKIGHFDEVVEPIRNTEVIEAGDLLRVYPYRLPFEPDMGGINLKSASQNEIGERVEACTIYGDVFKEWEPFSHMQTMVVLPTRAVCEGFYRHCIDRGIKTKIVDGTTPQDERDDTFDKFKADECQMLLGVDVVREGLDLPPAQCLIDLQPTHQFRVYWQKLGRVKRPHEAQETAVVIDLVGNLWRHMVHPDQDPPWNEITSDQTIEEIVERKAGVRCLECGSKEIFSIEGGRYKCEDCKHEWATSKPWVCPHCKQATAPWQKVIDGRCPNCSEKVGAKPVRNVRMADGSMRTVPADEIKRRKKGKSNKQQAEWDKWKFIAKGWNAKPGNKDEKKKNLTWCGAMYRREMGHWPSGLKNCPEKGSGDWERPPEAVYPWMNKKR